MSLFFEGLVAQRLEQRTHNPLVRGSNPFRPTNFWSRSLMIKHPAYTRHLVALDVGTIPV